MSLSRYQPDGCWIRPAKRLAIYMRDNFTCVYCGTPLKYHPPQNVTLDHLIPRKDGGSNEPVNLVTACRRCNSSRQAKDWQEFAPGGSIDRILSHITLPLNMALASAILKGTAQPIEHER